MASLRTLASGLTAEITVLEAAIADLLAHHGGYHAIRALPGIGPVLAAALVAEIGDQFQSWIRCRLIALRPPLDSSRYQPTTMVTVACVCERPPDVVPDRARSRAPAGQPGEMRETAVLADQGKLLRLDDDHLL